MAATPYFKIAFVFHWLGIGGETWKHSTEAVHTGFENKLPSDPGLVTYCNALFNAYKVLGLTSVFIEKAVISSWLQDTEEGELVEPGYDADESATIYYAEYCTRSVAFATPESLDVVLDCRKSVSLGHPGRFPMRGCLNKEDVTTNAQGKRALTSLSPVAATGATWEEAAEFIGQALVGSANPFAMAMLGARAEIDGITPETVRLVTAVTPVSARTIQLEKQ